MPNYRYLCNHCSKVFEVFIPYAEYGKGELLCAHCNSGDIARKIGRIRIAKSEESRLENLADPESLAGLEDDPRSLGRMMKEMSRDMGEELGPEFDEVIDRLESGQSPDEIESSMPDLGGDNSGEVGF